jgi:hypothetical protein
MHSDLFSWKLQFSLPFSLSSYESVIAAEAALRAAEAEAEAALKAAQAAAEAVVIASPEVAIESTEVGAPIPLADAFCEDLTKPAF